MTKNDLERTIEKNSQAPIDPINLWNQSETIDLSFNEVTKHQNETLLYQNQPNYFNPNYFNIECEYCKKRFFESIVLHLQSCKPYLQLISTMIFDEKDKYYDNKNIENHNQPNCSEKDGNIKKECLQCKKGFIQSLISKHLQFCKYMKKSKQECLVCIFKNGKRQVVRKNFQGYKENCKHELSNQKQVRPEGISQNNVWDAGRLYRFK